MARTVVADTQSKSAFNMPRYQVEKMEQYPIFLIGNGKFYAVPIAIESGGVKYILVDNHGYVLRKVEPKIKKGSLELWSDGELYLTISNFYTQQNSPESLPFDYQSLLDGNWQPYTGDIETVDTSGSTPWFGYTLTSLVAGGATYTYAHRKDGLYETIPVGESLSITAAAGVFSSSALVSIYSESGELLGQSQLNAEAGTVTITLDQPYSGIVLLVLDDNNLDDPDYESEATGEGVDLEVSLRAMTEVTDGEPLTVSITPLTELAVRLAGIDNSPALLSTSPLTYKELKFNQLLANLFDLESLTGPVTLLQEDEFDGTDGLTAAEQYGQLLAILSGIDENLGSLDDTLNALLDELTLVDGDLILSSSGSSLLTAGLTTLLAGPYGSLIGQDTLLASQPVLVGDSLINASQINVGFEVLVPDVAVGDLIEVVIDGELIQTTTVDAVNSDGSFSLLIDEAILETLADGAHDITVSVNDQNRLSVEFNLDTQAPVIQSGDTAEDLPENSGAGALVYKILCDDSEARLSLTGEDADAFELDAETGGVYLIDNPDYETRNQYIFTVVATDASGNQSEQEVTLNILYVDEEAPLITSTDSVSLDENIAGLVHTVSTNDPTAEITISGDDARYFSFDATTGELTLNEAGDFETKSAYTLLISATDNLGNQSTQNFTLTLNDLDEVAPVILSTQTALSLEENSVAGSLVYQIETDDDTAQLSLTGTDSADFRINSYTGAVYLIASPDYETQNQYQFTVIATDTAGNQSSQDLVLSITDVDEIAPLITSESSVTLDENSVGYIHTLTTDDQTASLSISGTDTSLFALDSATGSLALISAGDYETRPEYVLTVTATDDMGNSSTQTLTILLNDLDEIAPTILSGNTAATLEENSDAGTLVYQIQTDDAAATLSLGGIDADAFRLDASTGAVYLIASPDYEIKNQYYFVVVATDADGNTSRQDVSLSIADLDEVAPMIISAASLSVDENVSGLIHTITTDDATAQVSITGADAVYFDFNNDSGALQLIEPGDYENKSSYTLTVTAIDDAGNTSEQTLTVSLNNLDEEAPVILSGDTATTVEENSDAGALVYQIETDDENDRLSLAGADANAFLLDSQTGEIYLTESPDYEVQSQYGFTVVATDAAGNQSTQAVTLDIADLDEIAPVFTSEANITVNEASAGLVHTVTTDDVNATLILNGEDADYFEFNAETGELSLIESDEYRSEYSLEITAEDQAGNISTQTLSLSLSVETQIQITTTIDSASLVAVYSSTGELLGQEELDLENSSLTISLTENISGPVLLVLYDTNGSETDYLSVATGNQEDLEITLRAMAEVTAGEVTQVTLSPLTELAVRLAEVPDAAALLSISPLTTEQTQYNQALADLFELDDLLGELIQIQDETFDPDDGINSAELYGEYLGIISGIETNLGGLNEALSELTEEIYWDGDKLVLSGAGANLLADGLTTLLSGPFGSLFGGETLLAGQPVLVDGNQINAEQVSAGVQVLIPDSGVGDSVTLIIDGEEILTTIITEVSVDGDALVSISGEILEELDDGERDLVVSVNDEERLVTGIDIDTTAPILTIEVADSILSAGESTWVTFRFSEAVTGFSNDSIQLNGATLTETTTNDGGVTWTALYAPPSNLDSGTVELLVLATGIEDLAENPFETDSSVEFSVDTSRPEVQLGISDTLLAAGETATVTLTFSEVVINFDLDDLTTSSGSLSNLVASDDGLTYTATLTPTSNTEISANLTLGNDWTDNAGNQPEDDEQIVDFTIDTIAPIIFSGAVAESIEENSLAGTQVYQIICDDPNAVFTLEGADAEYMELDSNTAGAINLINSPDYESKNVYQFTVIATDTAGNESRQEVTLSVTDIDDQAPVITSSDSATIDENTTGFVITITSDDPEAVLAISGSDATHFEFDPDTGGLTLVEPGDFEIQPEYSLLVTATDTLGNVSEQTLVISLNDQDEGGPTFISGSNATSVDENGETDVLVYTIETDDPDATFSLAGADADSFRVDATTGQVYFIESADYEAQSSYSFIVQAEDSMGILVGKTVTMAVNDLDDTAPVITSGSHSVTMDEGTGADTLIYTVTVDDPNAIITLEGEYADLFSLDQETGQLTLIDELDYDYSPRLVAVIAATDEYSNRSEVTVTVTINDTAPEITSQWYYWVEETAEVGSVIAQVTASEEGLFELDPAGAHWGYFPFVLDQDTGEIILTESLDYETYIYYQFAVTITDPSGNVGERGAYIMVSDVDEVPPEFISTGSRSGGYVLVWTTLNDGDGSGIVAQIFDEEGNVNRETFVVNSTVSGDQSDPVVTTLSDGGFVIAWSSLSSSASAISFCIYDSNGNAISDEISVVTSGAEDVTNPAIASLSDGGFLIAWEGSDSDGSGIFAQRYRSDGELEGNSFQINSEISGDQSQVTVIDLADGGFLLVWQSNDQDGSGEGIFAQRYNALGNTVGNEFQVNTYSSSDQTAAVGTTLTNGALIIAWQSSGNQDGSGSGIFAQIYTAQGSTSGSEFQINIQTTGDQYNPQISSLAEGGFVVAWQSDSSGTTALYARLFDEEGNATSDEILISSSTNGSEAASVSWLASGGFLISWQDDLGASYTQEFDITGAPTDTALQITSGDSQDLEITSLIDPDTTTIRIDEGLASGTVIYTPYLTDQADIDDPTDTTDELIFSLAGADAELFSVDEDTGEVSLFANLDYETRTEYELDVVATDLSGTSVSHHLEIFLNDVEELNVIIDLVQGLSTLGADGTRIFDADSTYNIYLIVDSDSADLYLANGQSWYNGQNLGNDDRIILVGDDGEILTNDGANTALYLSQLVEGEGNDFWWGAELIVDEETDSGTEDTETEDTETEDTGTEDTGTENTGTEDTGTEDTGTEDTGTEDTGTEDTGTEDSGTEDTETDEEESTLIPEEMDLSVSIDARVLTRYYDGEESSVNWYVGSSDWAEGDAPNSEATLDVTYLTSLPLEVAEEFSWS